MQRLTQDIEYILDMMVHEAEGLAVSRESFRQAVNRATFSKGSATRRRLIIVIINHFSHTMYCH